jgi:hypothetical protein
MTVDVQPLIQGVGDSPTKKEAEELAALSAIFQLYEKGFVCTPYI